MPLICLCSNEELQKLVKSRNLRWMKSMRRFVLIGKSIAKEAVTGNLKHYPTSPRVITPADFWPYFKRASTS